MYVRTSVVYSRVQITVSVNPTRTMGGNMSRSDFEWVYTQQPHVSRRSIILSELY